MGRGQRSTKGVGAGSLVNSKDNQSLLKQDKIGQGSNVGLPTGSASHGQVQRLQSAILADAHKRVSFGLSTSSKAVVESQEHATSSVSVTDAESITLGEEDTLDSTPAVRQLVSTANASLDSIIPETENSEDDVSPKTKGKEPPKASFASLFAGNRQISNGSKLEQQAFDDDTVSVDEEEVAIDWSPWQSSLVGYFGGRFPGKIALKQIVDSWKVQVSIHFHNSGWIIFKFDNEAAQIQVLQGGPYMIFGRPLLLKLMPQFFKFENEALSTFPVWVQLRNLPLALWGNSVLSKICSRLGKPITTDKMTAYRERVSFARALVEVDVAKPIKHSVDILLPNGDRMEQAIFYENLPSFCSHCKKVGHSLEGCKAQEKATEKFKQAVAIRGKLANNVSGHAARLVSKPAAAGPSKPTDSTKDRPPSVEVPMPRSEATTGRVLVIDPAQEKGHNSTEMQINSAGAALQAVPCEDRQNRVDDPLVTGDTQLTAEQLLERGKNKIEAAQVGGLVSSELNSSSTAGKKKPKKKDRRKEVGQNIAEFCADMGGNSPNICPK